MTPEKVIELAKQAGFIEEDEVTYEWSCFYDEIQRFAELVRNEALEEAANACDERGKYWCKGSDSAREAASCATVIRSLKS